MNTLSLVSLESRRCTFIAVAGILVFFAVGAKAQQPTYLDTDSVTVDLSVLEDGGYGQKSTPTGTGAVLAPLSSAGGNRLILPSAKPPVSRLHVPAPVVKLKPFKNTSRKARRSTKVVKKPAMPTPPKAPRKPPVKVTAVAPVPRSITPPPPPAVPPVGKSPAKTVAVKKAKAKQANVAAAKAPPAPPPMAKPKSAPAKVSVKAPSKPGSAVVKAPAKPRVSKVKAPVATASRQQKASPAGNQVASLTPAGKLAKPGLAYQVVFAKDASKLPGKQKKGLKLLAEKVKNNENLRLQLHAYAGSASLSSSKARRLSLSRALSVRSYLIESGVRSTRIDVRALGNKTKKKPLNRVDINIVLR